MSNQRYITLAFLAGALIIGLVIRSACVEGLAIIGWPDPLVLGLINTSTLLAVGGGIAGFFIMLRMEQTVTFVDEVVVELRKIYWPPREETVNSTTVVLIATFTLAASLAIYDFVWAKITSVFLFS